MKGVRLEDSYESLPAQDILWFSNKFYYNKEDLYTKI